MTETLTALEGGHVSGLDVAAISLPQSRHWPSTRA